MKDSAYLKCFHKIYLRALELNASEFKISADKLNAILKLTDEQCYELVEQIRGFKRIYLLFDLVDMRYDAKKHYYKFKVAFQLGSMNPDTPSFMKHAKRVFNPALYKRTLHPRYDEQEVIIG